MNSKTKTKNANWQTMIAKNLSNHSDENFKLVQFLKTQNGNTLFDIRETFKGRATESGVLMLLPEYNWFKNVILSNDSSIHKLEHNNRIIKVDKTLPDFLITSQKINLKPKNVLIRASEISNLITFFQQSEEKIKNECGNMDFLEKSYYRMTIE